MRPNKKRISITLSTDVWAKVDLQIGAEGSRSAFIERVLSDHLREMERQAIHRHDLILINANAESMSRDGEDVLRYQADILDIPKNQANTK